MVQESLNQAGGAQDRHPLIPVGAGARDGPPSSGGTAAPVPMLGGASGPQQRIGTPLPAIPSIRKRVIWLLLAYAVVTGGVLAGLLLHLRGEAIASGEKVLSAFAQLAYEQTTRTIQNVEQTLQIAESALPLPGGTGAGGPEAVRAQLRALLRDRPFLTAIRVLDERERIIYGTEGGNGGSEPADRTYFAYHRQQPGTGFLFGTPHRTSSTGEWSIPATRTWRRANGEFAGVIVGSVDPRFLGRAWTVDDVVEDLAIALWREDGTLLMRSPFDDRAMGKSLPGGTLLARVRAGSNGGTYQTVSLLDARLRLVAYRRLPAYPNFVLSVTQPTASVLAEWGRMVWVVASGWAVATAALGGLAVWFIREWNARRATEDRYRLLFESNPSPVVVVDRVTHRFLAVNGAAVTQYGWSRGEYLAMGIDDICLPQDVPAMNALLQERANGSGPSVPKLQHRRKDGVVIDVEVNACPIELNGRPAALLMCQDVTERIRAEQARHAAEDQLRQSQKMEAVGQLTGGIAHDFNNILMVILANVDALQEEEMLDARLTVRFEKIGQAVQRASGLTGQLLAFSRKHPLRPQPTDINDVVTATGKLLRRALGEQIEIDAILIDDLWIANIDRVQLETTLINLCLNARDAMPEGGRLLIETRNETLDDAYVARYPDTTAGAYATLAVTDTGCGIPPDALARVFEPFFTTKAVGKGTGLGLSMVVGFVKQAGGHVSIDSEVGRGTALKLYFPRSDAVREEAPVRHNGSISGGPERILVVEDDAQVRASVVQQLQSLGYAISQAADGAAGVASFEAASLPYDLLLTDVVMPGPLNGKALAEVVSRRWPGTKIVFMSGYTENIFNQNGRFAVGVMLLAKPFRKTDLAQIVRRALDGTGDAPVPPV